MVLVNINSQYQTYIFDVFFFVKTFKFIFSFFILTVFLTVSVSAENIVFSENHTFNSEVQSDKVQSVSHHGISIFIDTESESFVSNAQPDTFPFSIEDGTTKTHGLRHKSTKLSLVQNCKFKIYNRQCLSQFFTKDIIFPFHSFW